jgi:amino acid adenylation domain-containing protein
VNKIEIAHAVWQGNELSEEQFNRQRDYWRRQLAGLPILTLPTDRPRPARFSFRGASERFQVEPSLTEGLKALSQGAGATLFMSLCAAFQTLLQRYTGQEDFAIGLPVAGRSRTEIEGLVGFFVNLLVLRTDGSGNPSFRELLGRVREVTLEAQSHADLPFEQLVDALQPERDLSRQPLVQVLFILQNNESVPLSLEELAVEPWPLTTDTAKFDLIFELQETATGLVGTVEYATDLFEAATIRRWIGHYQTLLAGVVAHPEARLSELPLLTAEERRQLLVEWNDTTVPYPADRCIHQLFEQQVARTPEAIAVVDGPQMLSYEDLNRRANQWAHHLRQYGVGPEVLVGLCLERSLDLIVGLLGILKAGGAYVPLDPEYPEERLRYLIDDTRVAVVMGRAATRQRLPVEVPFLEIERAQAWPSREPTAAPEVSVSATQLAYVLYTSGSTGQPKGVAVPHRGVVRLVCNNRYARLSATETLLQLAPLAFDASTLEIWGSLLHGAKLIVAPPGPLSFEVLGSLIREQGITTLWLTSALFNQMLEHRAADLRGVRQLLVGGEALSPAHIHQALQRLPECRLINGYGPTENTTFSTYYPIEPPVDPNSAIPIGRPIANSTVYILDSSLMPTPIGISGEIHVGGAGLARGYWNRPEWTAEKFIPHPFSDDPEARLYKTGDLGRYRPDGQIEFLGRRDHQVKIRGFRVELGEIEAVLSQHPAIRGAVVTVYEPSPGDRRLVAYVATDAAAATTPTAWRAYLQQKLPDYLIPSFFVPMAALPLTANGKVDRAALPTPDGRRATRTHAWVGPRTPVEAGLLEIWSAVLKIEQPGIHDSFFELGGQSLLAVQIVARIQERWGVSLPLRDLFEAQTIANLAERLERLEPTSSQLPPDLLPIPRLPHRDSLPLSFAQQRLWLLERLLPPIGVYHIPWAFYLRGPLDRAALPKAFNALLARHEGLRTSFAAEAGVPVQKIHASLPLPWNELDATLLPENEWRSWLQSQAVTPFELTEGPLLRIALLRLGDRDHLLLVTFHHIVTDGWSMGILARELAAFYSAFYRQQPVDLPELPIQYADYAVWQREWLSGKRLEVLLDYWRRQLAGLPILTLPTDRPRPARFSFRGASERFQVEPSLTEGLKALSQGAGATLFMSLCAAFQTLLQRYTGQEDFAIGLPVAGRSRTEIEGLVGFFVNLLVLRTDGSGNPSFRELLGRVREVTLEAQSHADLPFEQLVDALQPERDLSRQPLVQVLFILQNNESVPLSLEELAVEPWPLTTDTAKFDLIFELQETATGLVGTVEYATDLFEAATIRRWIGHYQTLLAGVVAHPEARLSELPLLTAEERRQLLVEWNDTTVPYPADRCIHQLFEQQVARTPEAIAVVDGPQMLSYEDLNRRANQWAHHLRQYGVGPEVLVGLCLERSLDLIVGLLGILKAGGAYVPLDPEYPEERLRYLIDDTRVAVVMGRAATRQRLPVEVPFLEIERAQAWPSREPTAAPEVSVSATQLAYVLYTSGSTGQPKGVAVPHRGVVRLVCNNRYARLSATETLLQLAPLAFDASTLEIWGSLLHGAKLIVAPPGPLSFEVLGSLIREQGITTLWLTSALFNQMLEHRAADLRGVRQLLVGGEALSPAHIHQALQRLPECRLINGYGPTENTTFST